MDRCIFEQFLNAAIDTRGYLFFRCTSQFILQSLIFPHQLHPVRVGFGGHAVTRIEPSPLNRPRAMIRWCIVLDHTDTFQTDCTIWPQCPLVREHSTALPGRLRWVQKRAKKLEVSSYAFGAFKSLTLKFIIRKCSQAESPQWA